MRTILDERGGEAPMASGLYPELDLRLTERARRMAGEAPRQRRRPQRPLIDASAHARGQRLRRAVEALAGTGDDRIAPRQGASERA